jgi:ataxin-3
MNSRGKKLFIYHEQQESALCGQHCLNNLLQGPHFTAVDLGEIAAALDNEERRLQGQQDMMNFQSSNVDDSGNFSIQVLKTALQQYCKSDLIPWHQGATTAQRPEMMEAAHEKNLAFVVNRSEHWFTIRKIRQHWWNLNSTSERPEQVSPFYLSAFLTQLRAEGYSVFLVEGKIPECGDPETSDDYLSQSATGRWYEENELLGGGPAGSSKNKEAAVNPFQGKGNRLGGDPSQGNNNGNNNNNTDLMNAMGDEYDEELELAKAISASLEQQANPPAPSSTTSSEPAKPMNPKEEMRMKRLAAMSQSAQNGNSQK